MRPWNNLRCSRRRRRGFTMMEATIALALLLLAILGMGALAGATVRSNVVAQDRTQATNLAERLLAMLRVEALAWNNNPWNPALDVNNPSVFMPLLSPLTRANAGIPFQEITQRFQPTSQAFSYTLNLVPPTDPLAKFCAHYRLTWLQLDESMRADVRVYWMRPGANPVPFSFYGNCGANAVPQMSTNVQDLFCVARSVVLTRNAGGLP